MELIAAYIIIADFDLGRCSSQTKATAVHLFILKELDKGKATMWLVSGPLQRDLVQGQGQVVSQRSEPPGCCSPAPSIYRDYVMAILHLPEECREVVMHVRQRSSGD